MEHDDDREGYEGEWDWADDHLTRERLRAFDKEPMPTEAFDFEPEPVPEPLPPWVEVPPPGVVPVTQWRRYDHDHGPAMAQAMADLRAVYEKLERAAVAGVVPSDVAVSMRVRLTAVEMRATACERAAISEAQAALLEVELELALCEAGRAAGA